MKRTVLWMLLLACLLVGCARQKEPAPVKEQVGRAVGENLNRSAEPVEDPVLRDKAAAAFEEISRDRSFYILLAETAADDPDVIGITPENSYNVANRSMHLSAGFLWSGAEKMDWDLQMAGDTGCVLRLCSADGTAVMECCEKGDVVFWKQDGEAFYARAVNPREGEAFEGKLYHFFRLLAEDAVSHAVWHGVTVDGSITDLNAVAAEFCVQIAENYRSVPGWASWKPVDAQPGNVKVFDVYHGRPEQFCVRMRFWVRLQDLEGPEAAYWQAGAGLTEKGSGSLEDYWNWGLEVLLMKDENGDWYCRDRGSGGYTVILPETGKDGPSLQGLVDAFYLTEGFTHDWLVPYHILEQLPEQRAELPMLLARRTEEEQAAMERTLVQVLRENPEMFPDWTEEILLELLRRESGA